MDAIPKDFFLKSLAFTKTTHIKQYDAVDPATSKLSQTGKVVVISGANRGLGRLVRCICESQRYLANP